MLRIALLLAFLAVPAASAQDLEKPPPLPASTPDFVKPPASTPNVAKPPAQGAATATPFKREELEQLAAPIALYPDALVAQILMASTYPLEVVEAARWSKANAGVKDKALEEAMQKQSWDESVKSLTGVPQVLAMMNEKLDWTQKLGDAFLAQQKEMLTAVQVLRSKAQQAGNLKSGKEQTVSSAEEAGTTIIKIEPTSQDTVYVPTYNPATIYGPWPYPYYPPYYYYPPGPPPTGMFFIGFAMGAWMWGGCNWGGGNVYINHHNYNNFNRTNLKDGNWSHRPEHRKGVGYRDQASRDKFGGASDRARADSRESFRGRADTGALPGGGRDADRMGGGRDSGFGGGRDSGFGGGREADAFRGMDSGRRSSDFSSRGASSRASMGGGGMRGGGGRGGRR